MRRIFITILVFMLFSAYGDWSVAEDVVSGEKQSTVSDDVVIILLKNQGEIKGVIKEEIEGGIVVDVGFGTVVLSEEDIETISYPDGGEKGRLFTEWKEQRRSTQITDSERKEDLQDHKKRIEENLRVSEQEAKGRTVETEKEHKIKFKDSSRIMVDVVLNGKEKTRLLVDTGANMVLIPVAMARRLGYSIRKNSLQVPTRLADGTVRKGYPITLELVEVAGAKEKNVKAIAMDLSGQDGLLGMSFLNRFHVRVDPRKRRLVLSNK